MADDVAVILVVDDNEMNRDMLSRRLKRLGHQTVVAEDGEKALEAIAQQTFNLILLDIMMPNLNGYDTLQRIKSNEETQHIPVIMISAVDDLESVVRCIELGAEDYLFKPFNPVLLKARVVSSLEKNRMMQTNNSLPSTAALQEITTAIHETLVSFNNEPDALTPEQQTKMDKVLGLLKQIMTL